LPARAKDSFAETMCAGVGPDGANRSMQEHLETGRFAAGSQAEELARRPTSSGECCVSTEYAVPGQGHSQL
jgi:hypothetical protein